MKPYYEHAGITIYHADCREVVPSLGMFDLLLADPPYGIGAATKGFRGSVVNGWTDFGHQEWDSIPVSINELSALMAHAEESIIWGGNYFALPPSMGFLIWDKGQRDFSLADCEYAWRSKQCAARIFEYARAKALQDVKQHPTQKPLELMRWCLQQAGSVETVLDPYMGSGTTLRACKDAGIKCVGIEINEQYAEIAAKRLEQEVFAF